MSASSLPALRFPRPYDLDVRVVDGRRTVLDIVRRRYVPLTPEEWVRQHLLHFLIQDRGCPAGLTTVEQALHYGSKPFRADVIVHDRQGSALLLAECKEPSVPIDAAVAEQVGIYNRVVAAPFLFMTNGLTHSGARVQPDGTLHFLDTLPAYAGLVADAGARPAADHTP